MLSYRHDGRKNIITELTLPEFAFVEGSWHENPDPLEGRTVILHTRTASVVEIFDRGDAMLNDDVLTFKFGYINKYGVKERMVIALHYSATLDTIEDYDMIIDKVMRPAAKWYCDYCTWQDDQPQP